MSNLLIFTPILALVVSVVVAFKVFSKTKNGKKAFSRHLLTFCALLVLCMVFTFSVGAVSEGSDAASETVGEAQAVVLNPPAANATSFAFIAAALVMGIASIGAGIALSSSAPAAIGAVVEDEKSFGKSMIFVALGEAIAIYGFIIAILIILKIPNLPTL